MKTLSIILAGAALALASCSTAYQAGVPYDDVYYSSKDNIQPAPVPPAPAPVQHAAPVVQDQTYTSTPAEQYQEYTGGEYIPEEYQSNYTTSESYTSPDGSTYITNNYYSGGYDPDDSYDYYYSSRLRRFHSNWYCNSYWDNWYTNRYWYSYDPWDWGVSIYFGYPWIWPSWSFYYNYWTPWYYTGIGWGLGYGWGWGYPYYYTPFYWGGSSYWWGYHNGYWDGYWAGSYDWYYNSYDGNTGHHYGPRTPRNSTSGSGRSGGDRLSFGERYEKAVALENTGRSSVTGQDIRQTKTFVPAAESRQLTPTQKVDRFTPAENIRQQPATEQTPVDRYSETGRQTNAASDNQPNQPQRQTTSQQPAATQTPATGNTRPVQRYTPAPAPEKATTPATGQNRTPSETRTQAPNPAGQDRQVPQRYYAPKNTTPANPGQQQMKGQDTRRPVTPRREYQAPAQERYTKPKNYTPPNYTKPKSSQEYVSPKTDRMPSTQPSREPSNPSYTKPRQKAPSYSEPQPGNNRQYTPAPRQESAPRSTPPSSSGSGSRGSYSAPSHSGSSSGSSGGGRSSGSSGSSGSGSRGRR